MNLCFGCKSKISLSPDEIVKALIGKMGDILELEDVLGIGRYKSTKVMLDVLKPLCQYRKLKYKRDREIQVDFAYERLPYFCFACGVIGHFERNCHIDPEEDKFGEIMVEFGVEGYPSQGKTQGNWGKWEI